MSSSNNKQKTIQPAENYLLCRLVEKEKITKSGIALPENYLSEQTDTYEVTEVGSKVDTYKAGDKIIPSGGIAIRIGGEKYLVVKNDQILLKI